MFPRGRSAAEMAAQCRIPTVEPSSKNSLGDAAQPGDGIPSCKQACTWVLGPAPPLVCFWS